MPRRLTRSLDLSRRAFVAGAVCAPAVIACDPRSTTSSPSVASSSPSPPPRAAMITLRPAHERFHTRLGWLDSWHSFSFGSHHDPGHMGFGVLRVINEDRVAPGQGFAMHGHRDMEIMSYVVDGALAHQDSMGNGSTIVPGDIQRMSAGTGVRHSEHNPHADEPVHFLQIWLLPKSHGIAPSYDQRHISVDDKRDRLQLVASDRPHEQAVTLHSDVDVYASVLSSGRSVRLPLVRSGRAWVQVISGRVELHTSADATTTHTDVATLGPGDGAAIVAHALALTATASAELLVFDLGLG